MVARARLIYKVVELFLVHPGGVKSGLNIRVEFIERGGSRASLQRQSILNQLARVGLRTEAEFSSDSAKSCKLALLQAGDFD